MHFRIHAAVLMVAWAGSMVAAQKVTTPEDLDKAMKKVGPALQATNKALASGATDEATKLKDQGNNAFRNQEWDKALEFYTKAIEAYNAEPSFYTNRAQVPSLTCCIHASANLLPDIHQARTIWLRHTRCRHGN